MYQFWLWLWEKIERNAPRPQEPSLWLVEWGNQSTQAQMPIPKAKGSVEERLEALEARFDRLRAANTARVRKHRAKVKAERLAGRDKG